MTRVFLVALLAGVGAVLFISFPQIADPLIRVDDYPGVFGDEWRYYDKTLAEGRWLNYWWIARETMWPAPVTFAIYQAGWAVFAAAAAANALGPEARRLDSAVLAILIALSPQAFLISGWFNTLTLGMIYMAACAVVSLYLSPKANLWLFLAAAPVSMLSYSTFPLMLMGLHLTRHGMRRSFGELALLMGLLAASIALGIMLMYTLNWYAHGVFGLQIAGWREPTPATDFAGLVHNLEKLPLFFRRLFELNGFGLVLISFLNVALLVAALSVLALRRPSEAGYILAGIVASVGLLLIHSLKTGVEIPVRSLIVIWLLFTVCLVRAAQDMKTTVLNYRMAAALLVLSAIYMSQIAKNVRLSNAWQAETLALAERLPAGAEELVFWGDVYALDGAILAGILHPEALSLRMRYLTGLPAVNCGDPAQTCAYTPPFDESATSEGETLIKQVGGTVFILLPKPPPERRLASD